MFLTYPFVDEVVGRDPQVARNLHMGDYTNLSIQLDIDRRRPADGCPACPIRTALPRPSLDPDQLARRRARLHRERQPDQPRLPEGACKRAEHLLRLPRGVQGAGEQGQGGLQAAQRCPAALRRGRLPRRRTRCRPAPALPDLPALAAAGRTWTATAPTEADRRLDR